MIDIRREDEQRYKAERRKLARYIPRFNTSLKIVKDKIGKDNLNALVENLSVMGRMVESAAAVAESEDVGAVRDNLCSGAMVQRDNAYKQIEKMVGTASDVMLALNSYVTQRFKLGEDKCVRLLEGRAA